MRIGIVIPHYKKPEQLKKCLEAIEKARLPEGVGKEVAVIDNNKDNIGFTKAVNQGLHTFKDSSYCVVLNQDCYIKEDFFEKVIDFMEDHPNCFIAGVKQVSDQDEDVIIHGGCTMAFPEGRHIVGRKSKKNCAKNKQMPWVNGACLVVNQKLLPFVGDMDENYFLIGSDSDWCYTARMKGKEVWYIADAEVIHEGGVSTRKDSKKVEMIKLLDMTYFKDKWLEGGVFKELHMERFG